MNTKVNPTPQPAADSERLAIDPMEIVRFVWVAARRNPITCCVAGALTLVLGLAIVSALPRRYESTSKIYVSTIGSITSQLTSGHRSLGGDEAAGKDIYEAVLNHENLLGLVRDARLVENWPATRNWAQRLIDRARLALRGPTSLHDMDEIFVATLERMIEVVPEDTASIRFKASWRDPWTAEKLTILVQRNYIAAKESEQLSAITRATTVLEDELRRADDAFVPAVTELKSQIAKLRGQAKDKASQAVPRAATRSIVDTIVSRAAPPPLDLTAKLNDLRNEERSVLEPWQRRTAELKFQLADLRAVYGPAHPAVVELEAKSRAASAEPVELLDIRQREAELKSSMVGWSLTTSRPVGTPGSSGRATAPSEDDPLHDLIGPVADDPSLAPARLQLETVLRKSQEMQSRLDSARMELALAHVGFKYRYRQVEPARFYSKPISPKVPVLTSAAVAAALVIGFLAGAGRELIRGRIMEAWQVKQVGLDVIATVDIRAWPMPGPPPREPPPRSLPRSGGS